MLLNNMNVSMQRKGNKILTITEYESEELAKSMFEMLKSNPQVVAQPFSMPGADKIIKSIDVVRKENKIIVTTEFVNEKLAECFYYVNKLVMEDATGNNKQD